MCLRLTALIALTLLPLGGCAGGDRQAADPLLEISGPEAFLRFELRDASDEVIWRLVAEAPVPLARVVYGEVPAGFRQEIPPGGGPPRPLQAGEPLTLESLTPLRLFHHQGYAEHGQRFSIDNWAMTLRNPPATSVPDALPVDGATVDATAGDS